MKKRLLIVAGVVGLVCVVGTFVWLLAKPSLPASSGSIPLPDGSWVHLEAITYGTNHLVGPRLALLANRMPPSTGTMLRRIFRKRASIRFSATTPSPQLVLWLNRGTYAKRFPPERGFMQCIITDTNGFTAGEEVFYGAYYPLEVKAFTIFPRRDPEFVLKIYNHDLQGKVTECGEMRIANPLHRNYPQWKPGSLPATRQMGDVEATLSRVIANLNKDSNTWQRSSGSREFEIPAAGPGETPLNLCHLRLRSKVDSNINWEVSSVAVEDATGNRIQSTNLTWKELGKDWHGFSPGLWTNESAWKLVFELKHTADFTLDVQTNKTVEFIVRPEAAGGSVKVKVEAE